MNATPARIAVAAILLTAIACGYSATVFPPPTVPPDAKCYRISYSADTSEGFNGNFPTGIALEAGQQEGAVLTVAGTPDTSGFWRMYDRSGRWLRSSGDTLELQFSNHFSPVLFKLGGTDPLRHGSVTVFWDFAPPSTAQVTAEASLCADAGFPPEPHRAE